MSCELKRATKEMDTLYAPLVERVWKRLPKSTIEVEGRNVYIIDGSGPFIKRVLVATIYPENLIASTLPEVEA